MNTEEPFNLLLEETQPVVEHTYKILQEIFTEYKADTGKKVNMDGESFVDIISHLSIIYHMLVVSVAEAIINGKDINIETQRALHTIKLLSSRTNEHISSVTVAEANKLVDAIFAKAKGNA